MHHSLPHSGSVLLLIDLQNAIDHPSWARDGSRNNPGAEFEIGRLLSHWRKHGWPVWHVRHDSRDANSFYRPGQIGNAFKAEFTPLDGEPIIPKHANNAFVGTELEKMLRAGGYESLVVVGVVTNNSVEATVRMAGNLGFTTYLVADGCFTFGRKDWNGVSRTADEVHAMSLSNLNAEYCTVITAEELLKS